ncbi:MAG: hypothetical protein P8M25_13310, partial [Paracoccaceae bacterium]|nr:hypothetical protein [Paracoccaceae bacterium]
IHLLHPRPLKTESLSLMEFCSGKPDNPAASVMDYCTGVLTQDRFLDHFVIHDTVSTVLSSKAAAKSHCPC